MKEKKSVYIISGPSGVGKGAVIAQLLETCLDISLAISATTRAPRAGEISGQHYYFLTPEEFRKKIEDDAFLEWCTVHGNYYGTLSSEVKRLHGLGHQVILEIDTQGASKVKIKNPDVVLIFISPPNFEELEKRLRSRNTDSDADIQKRLETAHTEMSSTTSYDYVIINHSIKDCVLELQSIILGGPQN